VPARRRKKALPRLRARQYSYAHAGLKLPHNTEAQLRRSKPVRRADLRRGDLIFFDEKGGPNSHVGIYLGDGTFVHAPSSGKNVRRDRLDAPYWREHLSQLRRIAS
jgi:murein DD-endopeptidase